MHELLAYPDIELSDLSRIWPELGALPTTIIEQLEIDTKYSGYLDRQKDDIDRFKRDEGLTLPSSIDYGVIQGLSNEARQKLSVARPMTLGQASRIDGITPAALTILLAHVKKGQIRQNA